MQRAWELSLTMSPHIEKGHEDSISTYTLFSKMPGAFPADEPQLAAQAEANLTPRQKAEGERRRNLKRLQRPR